VGSQPHTPLSGSSLDAAKARQQQHVDVAPEATRELNDGTSMARRVLTVQDDVPQHDRSTGPLWRGSLSIRAG
jgi:hypothetical protein